jgi:ribosomal protein S18 acetylase RimI-like enzyme
VPAILIGRLAVDRRYRGQGLGRLLLVDALLRSLAISRQVGAMAVVVDAKDDAARSFYEQYGFTRFVDHDNRLFLPMATIAQLEREHDPEGV